MARAIVDSNVLVAIVRENDELHKKAMGLIKKIKGRYELWVLNLVIQESATVVSMRDGMDAAKVFYSGYENMIDIEVRLDEEVEGMTWEIFLKQKKKGTSFIDCANLAVIEKYKLDGIITFDEFYPKELMIQ